MIILTATNGRPEIAEVWCAAVSATLQSSHSMMVLWRGSRPGCDCRLHEVSGVSQAVGMLLDYYAASRVRVFLEEDMIPVRPWRFDDYPGRLVAAQGNDHGQPWPSLLIKRSSGEPATAIVSQRFVRDGGCPDWLPDDLCEPALRANAKVLGSHFLHLDKMYRRGVPEAAAKNELLSLLRQRFSVAEAAPKPRGLGDLVKAGLSAVGITEERVSKAIGRPCGCGKRAAAMNQFGAKYLGLPPGSTG